MTEQADETPTRPAGGRPAFVLELTDGTTREVRPAVPDYIRWEKVAARHGESHAFTQTTYIVWAALRRQGDITETFEAFADRVAWFDTLDEVEDDPGPTNAGHSPAS